MLVGRANTANYVGKSKTELSISFCVCFWWRESHAVKIGFVVSWPLDKYSKHWRRDEIALNSNADAGYLLSIS